MAKAKELGGAVTHEPFDVPSGETIAGIADPEQNPIVLVQRKWPKAAGRSLKADY